MGPLPARVAAVVAAVVVEVQPVDGTADSDCNTIDYVRYKNSYHFDNLDRKPNQSTPVEGIFFTYIILIAKCEIPVWKTKTKSKNNLKCRSA